MWPPTLAISLDSPHGDRRPRPSWVRYIQPAAWRRPRKPRPEMGKKTAWQPGFCGFKQEKHTFANSGFKMMKANLST